MPIQIEAGVRVFKFGDIELEDPGAELTPQEVFESYKEVYPELTNGSIEGPEIDEEDRAVYEFKTHVGKKG